MKVSVQRLCLVFIGIAIGFLLYWTVDLGAQSTSSREYSLNAEGASLDSVIEKIKEYYLREGFEIKGVAFDPRTRSRPCWVRVAGASKEQIVEMVMRSTDTKIEHLEGVIFIEDAPSQMWIESRLRISLEELTQLFPDVEAVLSGSGEPDWVDIAPVFEKYMEKGGEIVAINFNKTEGLIKYGSTSEGKFRFREILRLRRNGLLK